MAYSYQRRNELARERGFKNYAEQRKWFEQAQRSKAMRGAVPGVESRGGKTPLRANRDAEVVRQWHEAFYGPDRDDYSVTGPKARWFIDVLGDYTEDEWRELYPLGVRG